MPCIKHPRPPSAKLLSHIPAFCLPRSRWQVYLPLVSVPSSGGSSLTSSGSPSHEISWNLKYISVCVSLGCNCLPLTLRGTMSYSSLWLQAQAQCPKHRGYLTVCCTMNKYLKLQRILLTYRRKRNHRKINKMGQVHYRFR